jgi:putative transcriptional regulator
VKKLYPKLIGKRKEKGITQEKIAGMIGISKNNYNLKENGKLDFNLVEVKKILEILNSKYEEIFFEEAVTENSYKK